MTGDIALAIAKAYIRETYGGAGALKGADGVGIVSIEQTASSTADGGANEITVTLTDGTTHILTVMNGSRGIKGEKGDPFAVAKTYTSVAEMEADFNNQNVKEGAFVVIASNTEDEDNAKLYVKGASGYTFITDMSGVAGIKGEDGTDGVGIERIERTSGSGAPGSTDTYTITMTDGYKFTFNVYNGKDGVVGTDGKDGYTPIKGLDYKDGKDGVSIASVQRTSGDGSYGSVDVYTITLTDGTTHQFSVKNGEKGNDGTTPHIGDNGNWFLGEEDTGVSAGGLTTGTFVGTIAFTVTLPASGWVNDTLTVTSDHFVASGYAYLVTPTPSSYIKYMASEVYAIDVMKDGEMTFHCAANPKADLVVNVLRMDVVV